MKKFNSHFYSEEKICLANGVFRYVRDKDGFLFSSGIYRTKIKAEELPKWYIYGRYYRCFGYLSSKNIAKLSYKPCLYSNHFLKDDCLYVTYESHRESAKFDYDERIFGTAILAFLKGAGSYSNYDTSSIFIQLQEKICWLKTTFPEEFGHQKFDIEGYFVSDNMGDFI